MRRAIFLPLAAALCASCSAPEAPAPPPSNIEYHVGLPLPAGAVYAPAGSLPDSGERTENLPGSWRPDNLTPKERVPHILQRGRIIVGVDQSLNLLAYRDSATGDLRGFEVDIAHEIARDIFGDPSRVDFRFVSPATREQALEDGVVDIVIHTMTPTKDRMEKMDFSIPYLATSSRLLVLKSSHIDSVEDAAGSTLCAADLSTSLDIIREQAPQSGVVTTRSWGDCLMALQQGQVDAVLTDDALLSGMMVQDPYTEMVGESLGTEPYAIAIRKTDAAHDSRGLTRQVNSTLERIRSDGTWYRLYNIWLGKYLAPTPLPHPHYREEK